MATQRRNDTAEEVHPVPDGYHSVTPFVIVKGAAKLLDFCKEAFGAEEMGRMANEDGTLSHAETRIGDSVVMMFDGKKDWPDTPAFLRLYVESCDDTYQQALRAGATSVTKPTDMPWGDRVCRVRDPLGNIWWIMTHEEDVEQKELEKRMQDKKFAEAMAYVQNADFFPAEK